MFTGAHKVTLKQCLECCGGTSVRVDGYRYFMAPANKDCAVHRCSMPTAPFGSCADNALKVAVRLLQVLQMLC